MRAISLFSGAGGFELGFQRAGIETILQAENDPVCLSVLARHWPDTDRVHDVREVDAASLRRRRGNLDGVGRGTDTERVRDAHGRGLDANPVDLVYGGFPCQDVSVAGNRAGLSGSRSSLWFEFERVLSQLRPRWVVVENVPGLFSSNGGRDFARVLMGLGELGYGWAYRVLDARWFGVPQRRRRIFIVGYLGDATRAAQVLAVCESCGGHPAQSPAAGEGVAYALAASARGTGDGHGNAWNSTYVTSHLQPADPDGVARPLVARATGYRMDLESENFLLASTLNGGEVDDQAPPLVGGDGPHGRSTFNGMDVVVANSLRAADGHHGHSSGCGDGADNLVVADPISAHEGKTYTHEGSGNFRTHNLVQAFDWQASAGNDHSWRGSGRQHVVRSGDYAGATSATRVDAINYSAGVRRLTPLECERLMGWPDGHTRTGHDGKLIADSHRYKLCGNGVVAPVAEWIGHRLVFVDQALC